MSKRPNKWQADLERQAEVGHRLIRRWYGPPERAKYIPLAMLDVRYWQARRCGWEPLEGKDASGLPCEPVASWFGWWCSLHPAERWMVIRVSRDWWKCEGVPDIGQYIAAPQHPPRGRPPGGDDDSPMDLVIDPYPTGVDFLIQRERHVAAVAMLSALGPQKDWTKYADTQFRIVPTRTEEKRALLKAGAA